jgi:PTH2 family peptidyl-tRNA hydrolase
MDEVKQVIIIRKDLKMRKGKMIAQGAHAAMKVLLDRASVTKIAKDSKLWAEEWMWQLQLNEKEPIFNWLKGSFTKVVVGVDSLEELEEIEHKAMKMGILTSKILDAGRTEFHGQRTITALAVGPEWSNKIDKITGGLKLL